MPDETMPAASVFYSYANEDDALREALEKQLSMLRRQGYIAPWHKRNISAGQEWETVTDAHLNAADIILLLVSPDFIASDYCYGREVTRAMERHEAGEAHVVPILLRPTDYKGTPFEKLSPLPTNKVPVTKWQDRDDALLDVTQGIRNVVGQWRASQHPSIAQKTEQGHNKKPTTQVWNTPYRRNPFFTGREELLKQLHARLTTTKPTALTQTQAISGLGGIGKTQTALEYAYRYRDEYGAVLWARAATSDTLITDFVALAALLRLPEQSEQDQMKVVAAVKHWLATHEGWLLILDNADDLEMACDFLPLEQQGHILLTTRG